MNTDELIKELQSGRCNFSGETFDGVRLSVEEHPFELSRCNFYCTTWMGCELHGLDFFEANLKRAIFDNSDLTDSDFTHANLTEACFHKTKLLGAFIPVFETVLCCRTALRSSSALRTRSLRATAYADP
jgi:uncharacterized protein YjbI with pentapeptide repeats